MLNLSIRRLLLAGLLAAAPLLAPAQKKPANALDFIKQYLGAPTSGDVETMKAEKDELVKKNEELTKNLEVPPAPLLCARCVRTVSLRHICGARSREPPVTACGRRSVELAGSLPCS